MIKRFAERFFCWFCHPDYYDEIVGDLEEIYQRRVNQGERSAQWKYLLQVVMLCRPSLMRSFSHHTKPNIAMFRHYFTISSRNLLRHKFYAGINITGLAIGLASFLLISEYVSFETSYDRFFTDAERIYRISTVQMINGEETGKDAMIYQPALAALSEEVPEIENYTVTYKFDELVLRQGENSISEKGVISADTNFLDIFNYQVLQGSPREMLAKPNAMVLTESKARFYFGDQDPLGQTIQVLGSYNRPFEITGVIEDVPENTHYKFGILISDASITDRFDYNSWNNNNYYGFVKLRKQVDVASLVTKLEAFAKKHVAEETKERFVLYPLQDIHLKSDYTYEAEIGGSEKAVMFMRVIALFILLIAWVNYINLATARAVNRAKEVGLRKVVGAHKSQLIGQFVLEALLINLMAAILALLFSELLLPYFNQLVGKPVALHVWQDVSFLSNLLIFFLVGTFASGFYPALVLSGFRPVAVLKGKFRNSRQGATLRKGLVVAQFAASIVLIAATFIVFRQVQFMKVQNPGLSTEYVVGFGVPEVDNDRQEAHRSRVRAFIEELKAHAAIETVGGTSGLPAGGDIGAATNAMHIIGLSEPTDGTTYLQGNDEKFLEAVGLPLLAGRNFDRNRVADTMVVMVNQAFLRRHNVANTERAIGTQVQFGEDTNSKFEIIGVVQDYNRTSLKSSIEPTIYFPYYHPSNLLVKLNPARYQEGVAFLQDTWQKFFPDTPLDYSFLDDRFAALYEQDQRFGEIFGIFSGLAIFIATLGLFGLSSFMATQRTAEVGVRKVLGATVSGIVGLFYQDFLTLLGLAGLVSLPVVYFGMNTWLESYAYRIDFPWLLTLAALVMVMLFALITVGYQIYRVAILNPAKTLRHE
uniref:ABC transporter permease n=1 Tax=Roseihalotalea indica TaxID=2867963 RepID=A0AA49JFL7_9BACT|nr:ABC transporter permease [Tunicatimonas sp. TK19036]